MVEHKLPQLSILARHFKLSQDALFDLFIHIFQTFYCLAVAV